MHRQRPSDPSLSRPHLVDTFLHDVIQPITHEPEGSDIITSLIVRKRETGRGGGGEGNMDRGKTDGTRKMTSRAAGPRART